MIVAEVRRLRLISIILLIDALIFYFLSDRWVKGADHSGLYDVLILQAFVVVDILLNFKMSKFLFDSMGVYKIHRGYVFVVALILSSFLALNVAIVGTDQWGKICSYPSCLEDAKNGSLKIK